MIGDILASMSADNLRDMERKSNSDDIRALQLEIKNLKMVCRQLSACRSIETRDKIVKRCGHLFAGSILRTASKGKSE